MQQILRSCIDLPPFAGILLHHSQKRPAMRSPRARTCATNGLFAAFILAGFGACLFHAWALRAGAGALVHLLVAVPGIAVCAALLYRYSRHWPARLAPLYRNE